MELLRVYIIDFRAVKKIRHKYKTGTWNNIKQREKYYSLTLLQAILKTLKMLHEFYKS